MGTRLSKQETSWLSLFENLPYESCEKDDNVTYSLSHLVRRRRIPAIISCADGQGTDALPSGTRSYPFRLPRHVLFLFPSWPLPFLRHPLFLSMSIYYEFLIPYGLCLDLNSSCSRKSRPSYKAMRRSAKSRKTSLWSCVCHPFPILLNKCSFSPLSLLISAWIRDMCVSLRKVMQ